MLLVDKCLESIYLLDEIEVYIKHVTSISNVTIVQKEKIVTLPPSYGWSRRLQLSLNVSLLVCATSEIRRVRSTQAFRVRVRGWRWGREGVDDDDRP